MKSNFHRKVPVLILGGGLAGLSAAYHLRKKKNLVIEKEAELGGTARSFRMNGFTFDITGHLLHLHHPYTRRLIKKLLKNRFFSCVRNTWIYSHRTYTRYPFQAYTRGLPEQVVDDCVLGFLSTYLEKDRKKKFRNDFFSWCQNTFGRGISAHFMKPYNEKLFQTPLQKMTADWCGPFVPMPKIEEVIAGALADQNRQFGYNQTFLYPKEGGIQSLPKALARGLKDVHLKTSVKSINFSKKTALLSNGLTIQYNHLINTIPLVEFVDRMEKVPPAILRARKRLKYVSILCLNLGVKRSRISDKSWIYFPEDKYPFYRVGFPMNFTPHVVPRGCSSMYVEIPWDVRKSFSKARVLRNTVKGLIDSGILKKGDKIVVAQFLPVRHAYVIYNRERRAALNRIIRFLSSHDIQSIGRYGAWKYSFMEEAILDGKKAADALK